ncbi:MAG: phosphoglycolate phosphatase [Nitrososphaerales archaeon]
MGYKAFVLDIDGTICDYEGVLNLEAAHYIRWLRSLGYEVLLASGRGPWDTFYLGVFLGCTKVAVCENGGVLMTSPSDLKIYSDKTKSLEAYDLLCKNFEVKIKPVSARLTEVVLLRTFDLHKGQEALDEGNVPVIINDSKFAYHLTKKGIDKSLSLSEALKFLGIDPKETVAIGDSETDIPMFELCGYSVAVSNASDYVKSKAKHVTEQEIGDGAVEAIEFCAENLLPIK